MFRAIDYIGVPSWLKSKSAPTAEEFEITEIVARFKDGTFTLEAQTVLVQWVIKLKANGKQLFVEKDFARARDMYVYALQLSDQVSSALLPLQEKSLLHSSLALCFLKLDCPMECLANCDLALMVNPANIKALYHGATALYMLYSYFEAMVFVERARYLEPESKDFEVLHKKISSNKISSTYSLEVIQKRLNEYSLHIRTLVESAMVKNLSDQARNVQLLLNSDAISNKAKFINVAEKMINDLVVLTEHCLATKDYKQAYEIVVDMHHIIFTLTDKYKEIVTVSYFDIFYKKALCLYYMDDFVEAHKNCTIAKDFGESNLKLMLLEARILYKKNQFVEALEIANKCYKAATEYAHESIIVCEELLFAIKFQIDQNKNKHKVTSLRKAIQKVFKSESGQIKTETPSSSSSSLHGFTKLKSSENRKSEMASEKAEASRGGAGEKVTKEKEAKELNSTDKKVEMKKCKICKVEIGNREDIWQQHVNGKKHKSLLMEKQSKSETKKNGAISGNGETKKTTKVNAEVQTETDDGSATSSYSHGMASKENNQPVFLEPGKKNLNNFDGAVTLKKQKEKIKKKNPDQRNTAVFRDPDSDSSSAADKKKNFNRPNFAVREPDSESSSATCKSSSDEDENDILVHAANLRRAQEGLRGNGSKNSKIFESNSFKKSHHSRSLVESKKIVRSESNLVSSSEFTPVRDSSVVSAFEENEKLTRNVIPDSNQTFPLDVKEYNVRVMCTVCKNNLRLDHRCMKNVLGVQRKNSLSWTAIRERNSNERFFGSYKKCANAPPCFKGASCTYAHSEEERLMWCAEKNGTFSIRSFIEKHKKEKSDAQLRPDSGVEIDKNETSGMNNYVEFLNSSFDQRRIQDWKELGYDKNSTENESESDSQEWSEVRSTSSSVVDLGSFKNITLGPGETFPLAMDKYNVRVLCYFCKDNPDKVHKCSENVLGVQKMGTKSWINIRERNDQGSFHGSYKLCNNIMPCFRGNICSFAHSEEERIIWTAEKSNRFFIHNFIKKHRNASAPQLLSLDIIYKDHPGSLRYICGECYVKHKCLIGNAENSRFCANKNDQHDWRKSRIILHQSSSGTAKTTIFQKPERRLMEICMDRKFCLQRVVKCLRPHSQFEQRVWMFLEESKCSTDSFVDQFNELSKKQSSPTEEKQSVSPPPHVVKKICLNCWLIRKVSFEEVGTDCCNGPRKHAWTSSFIFYLPKAKKELKPLPRHIPRDHAFKICRRIQNKETCDFDQCQFGHSQEEIDTWKWMIQQRVSELSLVVEHCSVQPKKDEQKKSFSSNFYAWKVPLQPDICIIPQKEQYYCFYCELYFESKKNMEVHNNTRKHARNIKTDMDMQWNYRTPPLSESFKLCERHQTNKCIYSGTPDEYNYCTYAHSPDELDEWIERAKWKKTKWDKAKQDHMLSLTSELIEEYDKAELKSSIITEHLDGVRITSESELLFKSSNKNSEFFWEFTIISGKKELFKVFLLEQNSRRNFCLMRSKGDGDKNRNEQCFEGVFFKSNSSSEYRVFVKFECAMFGTFSQVVVFDFGSKPVVSRTLRCEIGLAQKLNNLSKLRSDLTLDRWTSNNRIICFEHSKENLDFDKYKTKDIDKITHDPAFNHPLNKNNYVNKMHCLLYLEELEQTKLISKYNLKSTLEFKLAIQLAYGGLLIAADGELFAEIHLTDSLVEGSLMLRSVNSVWFCPDDSKDLKVYEAYVAKNEDLNTKVITDESVFIQLGKKCCKSLKLRQDNSINAQIQFQIDRNTFCRMHHVLDKLNKSDLMTFLFPKLETLNHMAQAPDKHLFKCPDLNDRQNEILAYVSKQGVANLPPMVVYGPFGTGKTETIARASLLIAAHRKKAKVLICTKSNLTADEYFKRHFSKQDDLAVLRVYNKERKLATVDYEIRNFCLIEPDGQGFATPTTEDIQNFQIVVTTLETSFILLNLNIPKFSYIFIDEAGQDLESRMIIPLPLADEKTCIVLAGDHKQLGEEIFSVEAKRQNFGSSLIERLIEYYRCAKAHVKLPVIFLNQNYRNHPKIMSFISKIFYGEEHNIKSVKSSKVCKFNPLEFYAVTGIEIIGKETSSLSNYAEVEEVVDRVSYLYDNWPEDEWGPKNAKEILVTSPYMDQIKHIRYAMRRKSPYLRDVTIIRVQNVPGMEFRAVFISTVRCLSNAKEVEQLSDLKIKDDFLSQTKLLNSAFSRAKSQLVVIGDPATLCSIGECSKIWIEYLITCEKDKSLFPPDVTVDRVKDNCQSLKEIFFEVFPEDEECLDIVGSFDDKDWEGGFRFEPDEIIRQLAQEALGGKFGPCTAKIDMNDIHFQEKNDRVYFDFENKESSYDLESELDEPLKIRDLNHLLETEPFEYQRCRIQKTTSTIFAIPLDSNSSGNVITIATRKLCSTAIDKDEVVVRIINTEEKNESNRKVYGEVVGILKRNVNLKHKIFSCFIEEGNPGVMIPINKGIPKMQIIQKDSDDKNKADIVRIYSFKNEKLTFIKNDKVNLFDPLSKLYAVMFLKWEKRYNYPLGVVVGVEKPGKNLKDITRILRREYEIPKDSPGDISVHKFCSADTQGRKDCRNMLVFTIDGEDTRDLDDAIGFSKITEDEYLISVHISDVSFYVKPDDFLDKEARERGTTFYPASEQPINMLPENLSTDLCSLKEGSERLALSVFMLVNDSGEIIEENKIHKTLIKSKFRLTYSQAEKEIWSDPSSFSNFPSELTFALKKLNKFTNVWRTERLGSDGWKWDTDVFSMDGPSARKVIEELMIQANRFVAEYLLAHFPNITPMRIQLPPNEDELVKWTKQFANIIPHAFGMRKNCKMFPEVCLCEGFCTCIGIEESRSAEDNVLSIPYKLWTEISMALEENNVKLLQMLAMDPSKYPQMLVALHCLQIIQEKSQYVCSGDVLPNSRYHYSLNLFAYTHFTSPIRRYIDLVVHRLLKSCIEGVEPEYSQKDIADICMSCINANEKSRTFERATYVALLCELLQKSPLKIDATVVEINENEIQLHPMIWNDILKSKFKVRSAHLNLNKQPTKQNDAICLKWSQRIYDYKSADETLSYHRNFNILDPKKHVKLIPKEGWKIILRKVINLLKRKTETGFQLKRPSKPDDSVEPVSDIKSGSHFCQFSLSLQSADMLQIQISSRVHRGLLQPFVQLLPLTKLTNICVEHNEDPVKCFSEKVYRQASKESYKNLFEYRNLWNSVLSIESAHSAVTEGQSAVIHNVFIEWRTHESSKGNHYIGCFKLDLEFCLERLLKHGAFEDCETKDEIDIVQRRNCTNLCIQYPDIPIDLDDFNPKIAKILDNNHKTVTLVYHCCIKKADTFTEKNSSTKLTEITCMLNQQGIEIPEKLMYYLNQNRKATVEWIEQPLPISRMMASLENLETSSELAQSIALKKWSVEKRKKNATIPSITSIVGSKELNRVQQNGINAVLSSSFSLIQGPPGTGKTFVAVRLINLFHLQNQKFSGSQNERPQIMCCGPSNKSVDVIAAYLLEMKQQGMDIVRVYSEAREIDDYPLPFFTSIIKPKMQLKDKDKDEQLKHISLHHLIRDRTKCFYADEILKIEEDFKLIFENRDNSPDWADIHSKLLEFKALKRAAEEYFLRKADIIMATCTATGGKRMKILKIKQLVIDECGMCMEPESMIPIVETNPEQIVLLGDHMQLKPIVTHNIAAKLGLETSLFQRYDKDAFMLTIQYRMHQAIAEFPSECFYDGLLEIGSEAQRLPSKFDFWPGGKDFPIAFLHVDNGVEERLSVSTEEGNVESKKNNEEATFAVNIAFNLVHHQRIPPNEIMILSQYRAQCALITKMLSEKNLSVTVQTVIAAQGSEQNYVILSTVRSLPKWEIEEHPNSAWKRKHLGFISDQHQINVALTRAKNGLVILGNRSLLKVDFTWHDLLKHYEDRRALINAEDFKLLRTASQGRKWEKYYCNLPL